MVNVLAKRAHATMDGVANFVTRNCAMPVVMSTANVKMAHACVWLDGTESTVLSKDVQRAARIMDNAVLAAKDYGNVDATMAGTAQTVRLHWSRTALIIRTMTKVNTHIIRIAFDVRACICLSVSHKSCMFGTNKCTHKHKHIHCHVCGQANTSKISRYFDSFVHSLAFCSFRTFHRLDGLVDCEDPECCQNHACRSSQLCVSAPKPIDVLLRKQPPAITASFFERMKFLIDEGSLQNYAKLETFNER